MNVHDRIWRHAGEKEKEPYHYKGCGLDNVYLVSGYDKEHTPHGSGVRIRNLEKLHDAIGSYLISEKKVLSGKELRFLRNQMNLTQSELARFLGCNAQQVARYEKDLNDVPGPADRLIRLLYKDHVATNGKRFAIKRILDRLDKLDEQFSNHMVFAEIDHDWKKAVGC